MINKAVFTLFLCISFTVVTETQALRLSFSESDSSVIEGSGAASVSVTKSGQNQGDVAVTLIPLSLEEARIQYGHSPSSSTDSAESGQDFSPALVGHVFGPGISTVDQVLEIEVFEDSVYENEELFLVRLNVTVSDPIDDAELEIGIQYLEVRLSPDPSDEPSLRFIGTTELSEGDASFITVQRQGESELPLSFQIEIDRGGTAMQGVDFELETGNFAILPNQTELAIPLHVIDDNISEQKEVFTVFLIWSRTVTNFYSITDNDVVIVRVANGSSEIEVEEGDSVTVCAEVESPALFDREALLLGQLSPGTAKEQSDYEQATLLVYALEKTTYRECHVVQTVEDDVVETVENFSFSLQHFTGDPLVRVQPSQITFRVIDDDTLTIQVSVPGNTLRLTEGETHIITVSVPEPNPVEAAVSVAISPGTAERDADFVVDVGTFTIGPGNSSLQLPLVIVDDQFVEDEEDFTLTISLLNSIDPPHVISVTIVDNDRVTVEVVNRTEVSVVEGKEVRVCAKLADITPSLLQREIVLEGSIIPGNATVNVDFVDLSWNFTFTSSSPDLLCVDVVTIDDSIPELPEKLVLEFATEPDPHVSVEPHFIEVLIINDDVPELKVDLVNQGSPRDGARVVVKEDDGVLDNLIRISLVGIHPFPLQYHVSITPSGADDVVVNVGTFTFPPTADEQFLPVTLVNDTVAEEEEEVSIVISVPGQTPQVITLIIQDNDVVVVSGTGAVVEEGRRARVCSCIISPSGVDRTVVVIARTVALTATAEVDYTPVTMGLSLNGTQTTQCFNIETIDNDRLDFPREFEVRLEVRGQSGVRQDRESVNVTITDNDGTPLAPVITEIKLVETDSDGGNKTHNLSLSWEATVEELRPIDSFAGTVTPHELIEETPGAPQPYSFSVNGNTTSYSVGDVELARRYTVEVCSENRQGQNCTTVTYSPFTSEQEDSGLPVGVVVSIVLVVVLVLVTCCLFCLCLCLCCCCPSLWRSYHPQTKEKKYREEFKSYREGTKWEGEIDSDFDSDLGDEV